MSAEDTLTRDLAEALAPAPDLPTEPSLAEMVALQRAVRARRTATSRRRQRRWSRRTAGLTVVTMLAGAGTAAAATGHVPLPRTVRAFAHDIGLPVESPEVHTVHELTAGLEEARRRGDTSSVSAKAASLQRALTALDPAEAKAVQEQARHELATVGAAPSTADGGAPSDTHSTEAPPTTAVPAAGPDTTEVPTAQPEPTEPPTTIADESPPPSAEASPDPSPEPPPA